MIGTNLANEWVRERRLGGNSERLIYKRICALMH